MQEEEEAGGGGAQAHLRMLTKHSVYAVPSVHSTSASMYILNVYRVNTYIRSVKSTACRGKKTNLLCNLVRGFDRGIHIQ